MFDLRTDSVCLVHKQWGRESIARSRYDTIPTMSFADLIQDFINIAMRYFITILNKLLNTFVFLNKEFAPTTHNAMLCKLFRVHHLQDGRGMATYYCLKIKHIYI